MGAETPPGGLTSDNPFKASAEQSPFFWRGLASQHQLTINKNREQAVKPQKANATLLTKSPHRKRISGLGNTTNSKPSGQVKKKELGGN